MNNDDKNAIYEVKITLNVTTIAYSRDEAAQDAGQTLRSALSTLLNPDAFDFSVEQVEWQEDLEDDDEPTLSAAERNPGLVREMNRRDYT